MDQILTQKLCVCVLQRVEGLNVCYRQPVFHPQNQPKKGNWLYYFSTSNNRQILKEIFWIIVNGILSTTVLFVTMREDWFFWRIPNLTVVIYFEFLCHTHTYTNTVKSVDLTCIKRLHKCWGKLKKQQMAYAKQI